MHRKMHFYWHGCVYVCALEKMDWLRRGAFFVGAQLAGLNAGMHALLHAVVLDNLASP